MRQEGLAVQDLADEVLVYDLERHRAHCLNRTAALVWRHCDGKTNPSKLVRMLEKELGLPEAEELVWLAIDRLRTVHLLQETSRPPAKRAHYSRREFVQKLKKMGLAASIVLPIVSSIISPSPAAAVTCVNGPQCAGAPQFTPCFINNQLDCNHLVCCKGQCVPPGSALCQ